MPFRRSLLFAACTLAVLCASHVSAQTAVTTYHYDNFRTGWNSQETVLSPANVNASSFVVLQSVTLDDQVDAQPLFVPNVNITAGNFQGPHDVVYVTTESNTIFAIDSHSGAVLLNPNFGTPVYQPLNCRHNGPNVGINSTPVIDLADNTLYAMVYTQDTNGPIYRLHALDLGSLTDKVTPQIVAASHTLTDGSTFTFNATIQRQRPGLLLANGNVYAGFGAWCDTRDEQARGWLLGWAAGTLAPLSTNQLFNTQASSPNTYFLSSIWMSGYGPAADDFGNVLIVTGNSDPSGTTYDGVTNIQQSVIKLSPDMVTVLDLFTPSDESFLDQKDKDFGSGGVLVLPDQPGSIPHLAVAAGKEGNMFLMNEDNLGGYSPLVNNVLGTYYIGGCWCGQSYYVDGSDGSARVVSSGGSNIEMWELQTSPSPYLSQLASSPSLASGQNPGFFTSVSSNGTSNPIIWALSRPESLSQPQIYLYAFNPDGPGNTLELLATVSAGTWPNQGGNANLVPVVANGQVYVAAYKSLTIFGLNAQQPQTITFTTNAPASAPYNTSFDVSATASSGLTVVFTASGVCGVVDHLNGMATYTMTSGTGACTVTASQPGNGNFSPAPQVTQTTAAQQATQTITFVQNAPATATYNTSFSVAATASSGLTVAFTASGICSVTDSGNGTATYTMTSGTGTCTVIANQAGDSNYSAAAQSMESATAQLATPAVTFTGEPASAAYGASFGVTSTTNASTFAAITSSGACSGSGTGNATITMTSGTGTCSMMASWAADNNYAAASASQTTTAQLATPAVTFTGGPASAVYNSTFTVTATTNDTGGPGKHRPDAENPAAITASGACSVPDNSQNSALVTMTSGTGTCSLTATWQADNNYTGATLNQSTTAQLATPTVSFTGAPASAVYNSNFGVTSTTNASTAASITSSGACSGSGTNSATITMTTGTGTCATMASWAADNNYAAATANQSTTAQLATPTVTFTGAPASAVYNSTFTVTATTNDTGGPGKHRPIGGGNPAAIMASGACSVPDNSQNTALVSMTSGSGTCSLTATWQADNNYTGATLNQSTTAQLATPTVSFTGAPASAAYNAIFTVTATTTDTGNPASITASGACSVPDNSQNTALVSMTSGSGTCNLTATWAADANYNGTTASQSTSATKAKSKVTFTGAPPSAAYNASFTVIATTTDTGNPASITASGACSVPVNSQNTALVSMTSGSGTCNLTATWAADNNYNGATAKQATGATKAMATVAFTGAPGTAAYDSTFKVNATTNASTSAKITVSGVCSITSGGTNSATVKMTSGTGACSLTAIWAADKNYNSAMAMQSATANRAVTQTSFTTSPNPSTKGEKVTFSTAVKGPVGDGVPTGTVIFQNTTGMEYATKGLSVRGAASFSTTMLNEGSTGLEAVYSGDSNFAASTSNVVTQVVNP